MIGDVLGNVTRVASTNSVFDYTYDPLNRVTNAVCLLTNIPGFATVKYRIAYQFDPVGNVTNRVNGTQDWRSEWDWAVHAYRGIMFAVFPALGAIIVSPGFVEIRLVRQIKAAADVKQST